MADVKATDGGTRVTVRCEPRVQLFDWGKSKENVNRVLDALDVLLGG